MRIIILIHILIISISIQCFGQVLLLNPKGTRQDIDTSKWKLSGSDIYFKNNGNVGLGIDAPLYKLDIFSSSNPLRILTLPNGSIYTDSIMVINAGIVKKIPGSQLNKIDSTTASNGLNVVENDVRMGGTLTQATTLTQNSYALTVATGGTNLNITGLPNGTASDSIVTMNNGLVRKIANTYNPSILSIYSNTQSTLSDAYTAVQFDIQTIVDPNYTISGNTNITLSTAGTYRISYTVKDSVIATSNSYYQCDYYLDKNGSDILGSNGSLNLQKSNFKTSSITIEIIESFNQDDIIKLYGKTASTSAIKQVPYGVSLRIEKIRP
jgi:hypothetical protein